MLSVTKLSHDTFSKMASTDTEFEEALSKRGENTVDTHASTMQTSQNVPLESPVFSSAKAAFGRLWSRSESSEKSFDSVTSTPTTNKTSVKSKRKCKYDYFL